MFVGGGRIRTFEGVSRQIYSLIPLAAREPLLSYQAQIVLDDAIDVNYLRNKTF